MKKIILSTICLMGLTVSQMASAVTIIDAVAGGLPQNGSSYLNFDASNAGTSGTYFESGVKITVTPNGQFANGPISGVAAVPVPSGTNGAPFGNADNSLDTNYLASGTTGGFGSITLDFGNTFQTYLGLLWGSVDSYNTLAFYNGNVLVDTIQGSAITPNGGNQDASGSLYVNVDASDTPFTKVIATSTSFAFEIDNVAYSTSVPDGGTTIGLLGLGLLSVTALSRRLKAKK